MAWLCGRGGCVAVAWLCGRGGCVAVAWLFGRGCARVAWHPESESVDERLGVLRAAEGVLEAVEDRAKVGVEVPTSVHQTLETAGVRRVKEGGAAVDA